MLNAGRMFSVFALVTIVLAGMFPIIAAADTVNSNANSVGISFDINADNSVKQTTKFHFNSSVANNSINYTLSGPVRDISVIDDSGNSLAYRLLVQNNGSILEIFLEGATSTLTLGYTADNVIFHSGTISHFFTEFSFERTLYNVSVQVALPPGYAIYQNDYSPMGASIVSDGSRIILLWNGNNVGGPILFSVKFTGAGQGSVILIAFVVALIAIIMALYIYFKRKTKEEFMKGFREDERKTITFIQARKTALQSDLQNEFGFSRAKSTRIVSRLESEGYIKKQRHGRTNKLFWLK
ncbi:MAG: hypothetical protein V1836_02185 [Candidatus Aenigmatarchaeota archaeon]